MKIKILEENYLNKRKKCYCWIEDREECYDENSCIKCSLAFAKYTLNSKERESTDVRMLNPEKLKKPDKEVGVKCFGCEHCILGRKIWSNKCSKYDDFCRKAVSYCENCGEETSVEWVTEE